ncbi:hypothetical protein JDM601_1364 [Mycolicibacter sinensis]|uniref:Uncharacterized protein n=2 Tax=Mycolicibacter sinensis (strain JDM601) TaxID=875328 RepID=F5YX95_MYCSD|nr:hypothetical protein JDM601_1364 [Mycolicibacter sinensis]
MSACSDILIAMTQDTWIDRDLPVLQAVVDIYEETGTSLTKASAIEAATGLDAGAVQRALRRLNTEPSFFEKVTAAFGGTIIMVGPPTRNALQVAGAWPSPEQLLDRLIAALDTAGDDDDRGVEERGKFKQLAGNLRSFASKVAISALGSAGGHLLSG